MAPGAPTSLAAAARATTVPFQRRVAAWAIATSFVLAATGLVCDGLLILVRGKSAVSAAVGGGEAAVALAVVAGFASAPIVAGLEAACARIARGRVGRFAWPLLLGAIALAVAIGATDALQRQRQGVNALVLMGFPAAVIASALLATWRRRRLAVPLAIALGVGALLANISERSVERVRHDLLTVLSACAALAATTRLRDRLRVAPARTLAVSSVALAAVAATTFAIIGNGASGWRVRSEAWGRFGPTLARTFRGIVDLDGDGFSPLFWGGDCDDLDATRNPRALEGSDGIDHNCNGTTPPANPTDADRGLAPGEGEPAAGANEVDRVLLVTIDCMRADALRPDVMPRLAALAARGVTMTRGYAVGSRTLVSLRFVQHASGGEDTPVTARLSEQGIDSTVVFSFGMEHRPDAFLSGFKTVYAPTVHWDRWPASRVTELGLEHLARSGRQYVWLHYYDAHGPIEIAPTASSPRVAGLPPGYLAALNVIDAELGRVLDSLDKDGRLARTAVIVTADHGEAFGAHGVPLHGLTAYEPIIHVPLVVVAPGLAPGRYDGLTSHRDLPATILGAFGLATEARAAETFGRSWLRLRAAPAAPLHEFVVSYSSVSAVGAKHLSPMATLIEPRRKLVETFEGAVIELYDPAADPGEDDDLAPRERESVARLRRMLAIYRDVDRFQ